MKKKSIVLLLLVIAVVSSLVVLKISQNNSNELIQNNIEALANSGEAAFGAMCTQIYVPGTYTMKTCIPGWSSNCNNYGQYDLKQVAFCN